MVSTGLRSMPLSVRSLPRSRSKIRMSSSVDGDRDTSPGKLMASLFRSKRLEHRRSNLCSDKEMPVAVAYGASNCSG